MNDVIRKRVEANMTAIIELQPRLFQGSLMEQTLNLAEFQYRMLKVYSILQNIRPIENHQ